VMLRSFIAAAAVALAASPVATRAAAPVIAHAGDVTVINQQDSSAPLVHVEFIVRAGLERQTLQQNGLAALTAETILRTPLDGVALEDAIDARQGRSQKFRNRLGRMRKGVNEILGAAYLSGSALSDFLRFQHPKPLFCNVAECLPRRYRYMSHLSRRRRSPKIAASGSP